MSAPETTPHEAFGEAWCRLAEAFLRACYSAWACGEPEHRVRKVLDLADQLKAAVEAHKAAEPVQ